MSWTRVSPMAVCGDRPKTPQECALGQIIDLLYGEQPLMSISCVPGIPNVPNPKSFSSVSGLKVLPKEGQFSGDQRPLRGLSSPSKSRRQALFTSITMCLNTLILQMGIFLTNKEQDLGPGTGTDTHTHTLTQV